MNSNNSRALSNLSTESKHKHDARVFSSIFSKNNLQEKTLLSKGNVELMSNESLNQLKFDSTCFQQAFDVFYTFNNVQ